MARVVEVYPDKAGAVRNVQVLVKPNQDGSKKYKPIKGYELRRHVSKLLLLIPVKEKENEEIEEATIDVGTEGISDNLDLDKGSSYNSSDAGKQANLQDAVEEVEKEPGGNVSPCRRSPRFRQTNA